MELLCERRFSLSICVISLERRAILQIFIRGRKFNVRSLLLVESLLRRDKTILCMTSLMYLSYTACVLQYRSRRRSPRVVPARSRVLASPRPASTSPTSPSPKENDSYSRHRNTSFIERVTKQILICFSIYSLQSAFPKMFTSRNINNLVFASQVMISSKRQTYLDYLRLGSEGKCIFQ